MNQVESDCVHTPSQCQTFIQNPDETRHRHLHLKRESDKVLMQDELMLHSKPKALLASKDCRVARVPQSRHKGRRHPGQIGFCRPCRRHTKAGRAVSVEANPSQEILKALILLLHSGYQAALKLGKELRRGIDVLVLLHPHVLRGSRGLCCCRSAGSRLNVHCCPLPPSSRTCDADKWWHCRRSLRRTSAQGVLVFPDCGEGAPSRNTQR